MRISYRGNEVKARQAVAEIMRLKPNLTISKVEKGPATKNVDRKSMLRQCKKRVFPIKEKRETMQFGRTDRIYVLSIKVSNH